jgi:hypothetical protein
MEAEVRLQECRESLIDIDSQLETRTQRTGESSEDFEAWKRKAVTARRGFEYEISRMDTCVRIFRSELASDKVAIALIEKDLDSAKESCRKLAEEVERLTGELSTVDSKRAKADRAFVEIARLMLSEVTYNRIIDRSRERLFERAG